MTLLLTVFAAIITTVKWYNRENDNMKLHVLMYMFWGASLMWFVDAIAEYIELGAEYFNPALEDMINDSFLGLSVIAFALIIWVVYLLVKDPKGVVRKSITK
ncbi:MULTISPECIES: hypothetical protein [Pseudobutyrivibrio]|jgi:hypothetical protein|uniref:Uncharacterized protein n=2 Tax=Pseudobutyrivibrio TaxID=46205 RepID=A0A2G3EBP3_9FIRM|nr:MULTISPECIES: hypothetical protein [Pseudobutyrivibrio]MBE5904846.1 hypothetical protein [Pseudobutyrivibrio sp.]NEX01457.1 hypothetical protein [Pseudobutyrivibrio xylanivorans]PHU34020.1 hypothetical protein CSX01_12090 [Pseudobutyrivibrio ruminis]PHU40702.1 hypothetical protein CSX00_04870 [Pseudobutyrivibrio ruminis]SFR67623.1 hypothetical protein SAMN04487829_1049 [Pseudobutyrivibrio sp. NOR37]